MEATLSTAAPKTFSPDLEHGTVLLADELLGDDHDVELAEELAAAADRLEDAKAERNRVVARLAEITAERPLADTAARKRLSKERLELAGEAGFLPNDIAQAGEAWCNAVIPWATSGYYSARRRAEQLRRELAPVEGSLEKANRDLEEFGPGAQVANSASHALGQPRKFEFKDAQGHDVGSTVAHESHLAALEQKRDIWLGKLQELRAERDAFADLVGKAQHSLTSRFGAPNGGSNDVLFDPSGPKQWLDGLRSRTKVQVAPFVGGHMTTQPLQEVH